MNTPDFIPFPKIARLAREIIVTEKIDGTNAVVHVSEDGTIRAGSKSGWISTSCDNHGFAAWVEANQEDLRTLGPGFHYGEWWGSGIQRGYGLTKGEKRLSLFNTDKVPPKCCSVVPVLYKGAFDTLAIERCLEALRTTGSLVAPGFKRPEGVVVYHPQGRVGFKKTLEKDEEPKSRSEIRTPQSTIA
jgi:hypothetical protein